MKKNYYFLCLLVFLFSAGSTFGQTAVQLTQYNEVLPLYNPAFSGIENHTDLRFGFRRQWTGLSGSPQVNFFHINGVIPFVQPKNKKRRSKYKSPYDVDKMTQLVDIPNNALRMSKPDLYKKLVRDSIIRAVRKLDRKARIKLRRQLQPESSFDTRAKHGYSATFMADEAGAFSNLSLNAGYAYHIPLTDKTILSLGISGTFNSASFDRNKAIVADEANDPLYQLYASGGLNKNSLYLNPGVALYSKTYYLSYGINRVLGDGLGSGQVFGIDGTETQHNLMGATYIDITPDLTISPGFLFTYKALSPTTLYASARVYYQNKVWLGINYRNRDAMGGSFGFFFSDKYKLTYAYDVPVVKLNDSLGSTHEIIFGILLKKGSSPKPLIY
ncbi:MAG: PorP/SprF family type IX secretion system membrane protein [Cyclobacteriaceae bacterium]